MTDIDKHTFLKHFVPTELEGKRKIMFKNGSSIKTKYKSEFKYWVKYLPGNYADYYSPSFIFKMEKDLKIIPIPNIYTFLFIPLALAILTFYEEVEKENIWTIGYFGVMVPPVSVKQCHYERSYKYIKI